MPLICPAFAFHRGCSPWTIFAYYDTATTLTERRQHPNLKIMDPNITQLNTRCLTPYRPGNRLQCNSDILATERPPEPIYPCPDTNSSKRFFQSSNFVYRAPELNHFGVYGTLRRYLMHLTHDTTITYTHTSVQVKNSPTTCLLESSKKQFVL